MDGTLKPSVLNGQRLDVKFKMAVNSQTGTMEELASSKYVKVCTSKRFTMFLKYFI